MWRFTADDAHAMVDTLRKDGDYLTMGFWLVEPDNPRGTYNYSPFYAGRDAFVAGTTTLRVRQPTRVQRLASTRSGSSALKKPAKAYSPPMPA